MLMITKYILKLIAGLFILIAPLVSRAQLVIDNTQTPTQLVQNVLLGGGVTASNITFTGDPIQISRFTATGTNLGLTSGIIMVTGDCNLAVGPNDESGATLPAGGLNLPGDNDLTAVSGFTTNDAAVLEFDFIPTSDTIKFRYVFASDEYLEFVNSSFNDVFAFFLTGPGYSNTNIALVPGTTTPVSINNVNDVSYPAYYVNNGDGFSSSGTIEFDGFTTTLTAVAAVQCGVTYRIKLAIADAGDAILDSGVFLEAGSFTSVGDVQIIPDVAYSTTNDTTLYEGCGAATIGFVRNGNNGQALTINYTVSGTSTNGVDYNNLNGSITIPAGQDTAFVTVNPLDDGIPEGAETLTITVTNTVCQNQTVSSVTVYIQDVTPLTVDAGPDQSTACTGGGNINITANATNGVPTYTYSWDTGENTQSIVVLPANTTTYTVTATDICGNTATDDVTVAVEPPQPLSLTVTNDTVICQGQIVNLNANAVGGNGTINYSWDNGINTASQQVSPPVNTIYTVTVTDACNQTLTDAVAISVEPNNALFDYLFVSNNQVQFDNQSVGYDNLVFWDFGDSTTSNLFEPTHTYAEPGTYTVTLVVENSVGCLDTIQYILSVRPDFYFYIPNAFTPNRDGTNETFNGKGQGFEVYSMTIYNRWGSAIFTTNDLNNGWNGDDKNGNTVPNDVYVYVVRIKITPDQEDDLIFRGKVVVVR